MKILGIDVEVVRNASIMNAKGPKFSHIFKTGSTLLDQAGYVKFFEIICRLEI